MGNCQAIDAATLVIQHPSGKVDKLYWPVTASEIMKSNPGHYAALLLSTTLYPSNNPSSVLASQSQCPPTKESVTTTTTTITTTTNTNNGSVRLTRIKLLRPTDTLLLGHVYRLITAQEVMKVMWAKKQAKMKKNQPDKTSENQHKRSDLHKDHQVGKHERNRPSTTTTTANSGSGSGANRSRATWQPSLKSISESGS